MLLAEQRHWFLSEVVLIFLPEESHCFIVNVCCLALRAPANKLHVVQLLITPIFWHVIEDVHAEIT